MWGRLPIMHYVRGLFCLVNSTSPITDVCRCGSRLTRVGCCSSFGSWYGSGCDWEGAVTVPGLSSSAGLVVSVDMSSSLEVMSIGVSPGIGSGGRSALVVTCPGVVFVIGTIGWRDRFPSMLRLRWISWTGTYFRRNFLFRRLTLRDPSMRTTYWLCCLTSTTCPVLSHFLG